MGDADNWNASSSNHIWTPMLHINPLDCYILLENIFSEWPLILTLFAVMVLELIHKSGIKQTSSTARQHVVN